MTRDKETAKERTFKTFIRMSMVRQKKKKRNKRVIQVRGELNACSTEGEFTVYRKVRKDRCVLNE
jgi:hypothetical protein